MVDKLLKPSEVAEMLSISVWSVYDYIKRGYLADVTLPSGRKRIPLSHVQNFIKTLKEGVATMYAKSAEKDDLNWTLDFLSRYNRFPSSEELAQRRRV